MDKQALLDELYAEYAQTPVLLPLSCLPDGTPVPVVRGHGPLTTPIVVVGEAPGAEEVAQGRPFTGASGQLLQGLFRTAGVPWELCYVTNVIPWRPPGNRTPYPYEVMASWHRVEREIAVIGPKVVIIVGATAWHGVTRNAEGRFAEFRYRWLPNSVSGLGYDAMTLHHPAWILRQPEVSRGGYQDQVVKALVSMFPEERYDDGER